MAGSLQSMCGRFTQRFSWRGVHTFLRPGHSGSGPEPSPALQPRPEPERRGGAQRRRGAPAHHAALGAHSRIGERPEHRAQAHQCPCRDRGGEALVPGRIFKTSVSCAHGWILRVATRGRGAPALAHRAARRGNRCVRGTVGAVARARGCGASRVARRASFRRHRRHLHHPHDRSRTRPCRHCITACR